uniref:Unannotated protein n=1 Tax=freshwater metagenome TaxID=449393 RepID=A0A6J5ZQ49_9ZZZZ
MPATAAPAIASAITDLRVLQDSLMASVSAGSGLKIRRCVRREKIRPPA